MIDHVTAPDTAGGGVTIGVPGSRHGLRYDLPVHQIGGVVDSGSDIEGGAGGIEIIPDPCQGGIGMIAGNDRIHVGLEGGRLCEDNRPYE